MVVFSLVCSAPPVSPFGNVSSSMGNDGALISWEYWGPEKNVYVEYIVENSKQSNTPLFLTVPQRWQETPTSLLACVGEHKYWQSRWCWLLPNVDPDVINKAVCDWIANYPGLLLKRFACISHDNLAGAYSDKHYKKQHKHSWFLLKCSSFTSTYIEDENTMLL